MMSYLLGTVIICVVLVLGVYSLVSEPVSKGRKRKGRGKGLKPKIATVRYQAKNSLLTANERTAFKELAVRLRQRAYLCPKVRIADIVNVRCRDRRAWQSAFNRIAMKHVDFVVLSRQGKVLFAVEIDDSTHLLDHRKKRDELVDNVFSHAGIPLVRIEPGGVIGSSELTEALDRFWPKEDEVIEPSPVPTAASTPQLSVV
jgi:hypothetical protein